MFIHKICKNISLKYKEKENSNLFPYIFSFYALLCVCVVKKYIPLSSCLAWKYCHIILIGKQ